MEYRCADCECVVERGVRAYACSLEACCCRELPVRGSATTLDV